MGAVARGSSASERTHYRRVPSPASLESDPGTGAESAAIRDSGGGLMIVVRFKVQCRPETTEQVRAAFEEALHPTALD